MPAIPPGILRTATMPHGDTLDAVSRDRPALVVFLRHGGCPFCREALAEIARRRAEIERPGTRIVLVHMLPDAAAAAFFARYGLDDLPRISDPDRTVYAAFELRRGGLMQVMGPRVWWRGLTAMLNRHGVGRPVGDVFQLPGAFLVHRGEIVKAFRPATSAGQPDYVELATCALPE